MARRRKKMALYEVIHKTQVKRGRGKSVEPLRPEKPHKDESSPEKPVVAARKPAALWPSRPKMFQLSADRIEISMPYQLAVAVLLGLVLLLLVVFQLGQAVSERRTARASGRIPASRGTTGLAPMSRETVKPVASEGKNRIVIQTYHRREDLEPVQEHFARRGIDTEIRLIGNRYYLLTKEKYENPEKEWTDGNLAKRQIIAVGADYKAPPGYETFGAQSFQSAHGMKFDD